MVRQYTQHVDDCLGGQSVASLQRQGLMRANALNAQSTIRMWSVPCNVNVEPPPVGYSKIRHAHVPCTAKHGRNSFVKGLSEACKTMVGLLVFAVDGHEAPLSQEFKLLLELDQLPDLNALTQ